MRLPPWVPAAPTVDAGRPLAHRTTNGYLLIPEPPINRPVAIGFALPQRDMVLKHRTRDIRVRLRGSQVVAMDDFGADLTFFDSLN